MFLTMEHMNKIIPYTTDRYMVIDSSSRRNLELVETLREKQKLEQLWEAGNAPWKVWEK